jgi:glutamine synthetase
MKEVFTPEEFKKFASSRIEHIKEIGNHVIAIKSLRKEMIEARKSANVIVDAVSKARAYDTLVKPYLEEIREHIDKLELTVDDEKWPLPKYRELLFTR